MDNGFDNQQDGDLFDGGAVQPVQNIPADGQVQPEQNIPADGQSNASSDSNNDRPDNNGDFNDDPYGPADPMEVMLQQHAQTLFLTSYQEAMNSFPGINDWPDQLFAQRRAVFFLVGARRISDDQVISDASFDNIENAIGNYLEWDVVTGIPDRDLSVRELADALYRHMQHYASQQPAQNGNPYRSAWSLRYLKIVLFSYAFAEVRRCIAFAERDGAEYTRDHWFDVQTAVMRAVNGLRIPDDTVHIFVNP